MAVVDCGHVGVGVWPESYVSTVERKSSGKPCPTYIKSVLGAGGVVDVCVCHCAVAVEGWVERVEPIWSEVKECRPFN